MILVDFQDGEAQTTVKALKDYLMWVNALLASANRTATDEQKLENDDWFYMMNGEKKNAEYALGLIQTRINENDNKKTS